MERRSIDVIPDDERHGTPREQFTLWFGANMQITTIVDGALAVVFEGIHHIQDSTVGILVFGALTAVVGSVLGSRSTSPTTIRSLARGSTYPRYTTPTGATVGGTPAPC